MVKLISCIYLLHDDKHLYIGKTTNLMNRLNTHRSIGNTASSKLLNPNFKYIILKEEDDLNVLNQLEQSCFDICKKYCGDAFLNKKRPMNTCKDYYERNKDAILSRHKNYRETHKQYFTDYYKSSVKDTMDCSVCSCKLSKYHYDKHLLTNKHAKNLKNNIVS